MLPAGLSPRCDCALYSLEVIWLPFRSRSLSRSFPFLVNMLSSASEAARVVRESSLLLCRWPWKTWPPFAEAADLEVPVRGGFATSCSAMYRSRSGPERLFRTGACPYLEISCLSQFYCSFLDRKRAIILSSPGIGRERRRWMELVFVADLVPESRYAHPRLTLSASHPSALYTSSTYAPSLAT